MSAVLEPAAATTDGSPDPVSGRAAKARRRTPPEPSAGRGKRAASPGGNAVNLLSPWVLEELKVRRLRRRFAFGALALVVLVAASWGLLRLSLGRAEQALDDERAIAAQLQAQISDLSDVRIYVSDVTARATDVEDTMAQEVAMSRVLDALDDALPDGASYDDLAITLPPAGAVAGADATTQPTCPGPDPFEVRPVVGCIAVTGTAQSRDDVSTLVQDLAASDLFVEPFVNTTTTSTSEDGAAGTVQFVGSIGLGRQTLTDRYADLDGNERDRPDETDQTDRTDQASEEGDR